MIRLRDSIATAVAVAGLVAPVVQAATIDVRQTLVARQSNGAYDAAYPDGDDASPLVWGPCPNIELTTATTQNYNLRTLCGLTGTNALTAALSKASGTLPTGCIAGTDGIECTTPSAAGPNALVWRATDGTPADSNSFTITVTDTLVPDVTDPTIPTGCSGVGGTGIVTVTCDQSSDPYVSGAGSGVASYKVYLGGVLQETKTAPSPNIQQEMAGVTVGAADGTQSCTRTGANLAMSGGGAGLGATADQFYGCGYTITGDFVATAKLTGFAGAVTTGTAGLMARASDDVGSIYGTARGRDSDDKANNRYRTATDGTAANATLTAAQSYPYWLRLLVSGGSVTAYTSTDGNTWAAAGAPVALSLGATPYLLAFHASGTAGTPSTSGLEQINIAPVTQWSQVVTTDVGGSFRVTAVDAAGNESDQGPAFVATPSEPAGGGGACTGDSAVSLVHWDDFNDAVLDTARWNTSTCQNNDALSPTQDVGCGEMVATRAREGDRSLRVQLSYHDGAGTWYHKRDVPTDEIAHRNGFRNRAWTVTGFDPNAQSLVGKEMWYGFSVYVPGAADPLGDPAFSVSSKQSYLISTQWHDSPDVWTGTTGTGTNATTVVFNATISALSGCCVGGDVTIGGQTRKISAYDSGTHTATVSIAFSPAPTSGQAFTLKEQSRNPMLAFTHVGVPAAAQTVYPETQGTISTAQTSPPTIEPTWLDIWNLNDADQFQGHRQYDGGRHFWPSQWKPDERGMWIDWVVRYKATHTASGILQAWKRRVGVDSGFSEMIRYLGPNAFNDKTAPYFWIGQYSGRLANNASVPADWPEKTVYYYDAYKHALTLANPTTAVGTDNCAFQLVAPSGTPH